MIGPKLLILHTVPVPRDGRRFHLRMVDASSPRWEEQGLWMLDFAYKPLRVKTVDIPGKGKRQICYLYYRVVNRSGTPRMFAPRFIMLNDKDEKFEANVVPQAIPAIQAREDPAIPILEGVDINGILPASTKPDVDDAVYGVATWEKWDHKADHFRIYVRGLSGVDKAIPSPSGGKPSMKDKTLKIDFIRRADRHNINLRQIQLADPPHEWIESGQGPKMGIGS